MKTAGLLNISLILFLIGTTCRTSALEWSPQGEMKAGGLSFAVHVFSKDWKGYSQGSKKYFSPVEEKNQKTVSGSIQKISIPGLPEGKLETDWQRRSEREGNYRARLQFPDGAELKTAALCVVLPAAKYRGAVLQVDDRTITLPEEFRENSGYNLHAGRIQKLVLPGNRGPVVLTGNWNVQIQDSRRYGKDHFLIRIEFQNSRGKIRSSEFSLKVREENAAFSHLDFRQAANMGFADSRAEDGVGGWTDQGPESDLRSLPHGEQFFQGVCFEILDPQKNNGKSCLMLAGRHRPAFPVRAVCPLRGGGKAKFLYLLHGSAWTENRLVGTVRAVYQDGSASEFSVLGNRDVGNWKDPIALPRADVAWHVDGRDGYIGLYLSCFSLEEKVLDRVEFVSAQNSVWGIVAASISDFQVLRSNLPFYIVAEKKFCKLQDYGDVEKGSCLDFSHRLDAPAGKYGPIQIHNGQFVFRDRPDFPIRFYGTNLCSDVTVPEREWAEKIADRIARLGFNIIRLHHHDKLITNWRKNTTELDAGMLDRMDYLVYCLKQRGIYIITDFFVSRSEFIPEGEIPEHPGRFLSHADYKALLYISDPVFENWKAFCHAWINHVNPYTGVALKDDPVYIGFGLVNEGNPSDVRRWAVSNAVRELYKKRFMEWMKQHHPEKKAVTENHDPLFTRFLMELYDHRHAQMVEFIRSEGIQTPLSDQNMFSSPVLSWMRRSYDFVDNHCYWTKFRYLGKYGQLPAVPLRPHSLLKEYAKLPGDLFSSRIFGKPFAVTEFDSSLPNEFRVEAPPVTAAYAALQDWSILCQFAYSHRIKRIQNSKDTSSFFDLVNDPLKRLANQLAARLFLDGGMEAAPPAFAIAVPEIEGLSFQNAYPEELIRLGLIARLGSVTGSPGELPQGCRALLTVGGKKFPGLNLPQYPLKDSAPDLLRSLKKDGLLPENSFSEKDGVYRSATGQIELNARRQTFKLVSPFCELLILPSGMKSDTGGIMTVQNRKERALFALLAIDGKKIGESRHLLLFHLTSAFPSMMKFSDSKKSRLDAWGQAPWLVAKGEASLLLKLPETNAWTVYSLTAAGKRIDKCEVKKNSAGKLLLTLRNFHSTGCIPLYELIR